MTDIQIVRLLIGDTDSDSPILSDAQIQYYLDEYDDTSAAAPYAAQAVYAQMSLNAVQASTGSISTDWSRRADAYRIFLRERGWDSVGGFSLTQVFGGGLDQDEIDDALTSDTLPARKFKRSLHEVN